MLIPDHLDVQGLADLLQCRRSPSPDALGREVRLHRFSEVHVPPQHARHLQTEGLAVQGEHEFQVGAAVGHGATRPPRQALLREGPLQSQERVLQGARLGESLFGDAREVFAELRDRGPQVLAVVLALLDLAGSLVIDGIRELDDLALLAVHLPVLPLVAGPLEIHADPELDFGTARPGGCGRSGRCSRRRGRRTCRCCRRPRSLILRRHGRRPRWPRGYRASA
mmetsp:Transcript_156074/g.478982  ORF Transcript_156074/g.478982 Transcript_156074/m.478982 type:complete len:224 (+) Transcript_156074:867-1538(+)